MLVILECFSEGRSLWQFWHNVCGHGTFAVSTSAPLSGKSSAVVYVRSPGDNIQLYQHGFSLQPNTTYELSFAAYSDKAQNMSVHVHKHGSPYTSYGLAGQSIDLGNHWNSFKITFTTPNLTDMNDGRLRFWFANTAKEGSKYYIGQVVLRQANS